MATICLINHILILINMFTRKEETSSYSKKYTIACLFAACSCVALGYYGQSAPVESLEKIQSNYD